MEWDGEERRNKSRLTDDQKQEIYESVRAIFEQRVGRAALAKLRKVCGALCYAGLGYAVSQLEKWFK